MEIMDAALFPPSMHVKQHLISDEITAQWAK